MAKVKVPKKVAGVKVPKKVRRQAKKALRMVETPAARNLALAGLAMAAEAFIDRTQAKGTARKAAKEALKQVGAGKKLRALEGFDGAQLGEVLRAAAVEGARRFLEGFEEGQKKVAEAVAPDDDKPKARKSNGRRAAAMAE